MWDGGWEGIKVMWWFRLSPFYIPGINIDTSVWPWESEACPLQIVGNCILRTNVAISFLYIHPKRKGRIAWGTYEDCGLYCNH